MIKALIFDVDGTLAETEEGHRRAFNAAFAEAGLDWAWDVALYRELYRVTGGRERMRHYAGMRGLSTEEVSDADIASRIVGYSAPPRPSNRCSPDAGAFSPTIA